MSIRLHSCHIALCLILLGGPAASRTVHGTVTDPEGMPVAGAAVRLKNTVTLRIRSARTGRDGNYRFSGVDPKTDYELRASHKRVSSGWIRLSRFNEGTEKRVDLRLK